MPSILFLLLFDWYQKHFKTNEWVKKNTQAHLQWLKCICGAYQMKLKGIHCHATAAKLSIWSHLIRTYGETTKQWRQRRKKTRITLIIIIITIIVIDEVVTPMPCAVCERRCASQLIPRREITNRILLNWIGVALFFFIFCGVEKRGKNPLVADCNNTTIAHHSVGCFQ